MNNFLDMCVQASQSTFVHHSLKLLEAIEGEGDALFSIACIKDSIFRKKRAHFKKNKVSKIIVVTNTTNFGYISPTLLGREINVIPSEMLENEEKIGELIESFDNSIVVSTSNIFGKVGAKTFCRLYDSLPNTIFVMHDYENHHWINTNIQVAIFSDVYAPAHLDENLLASRINPNILGGVPCGSNQWSAEFIKNFGRQHLLQGRSSTPLGKYFFYEKFMHRNKSINTLSQNYPEIGFVTQDFHALSPEEKWKEWSNHSLHWIAPVLNDLPIRFFDALITGGIPLIPSGLKPFANSLEIPEEFYGTYGPLDILDPGPLLALEEMRFNKLGAAGIMARHQFALEHFHIDVILSQLIEKSLRLYES